MLEAGGPNSEAGLLSECPCRGTSLGCQAPAPSLQPVQREVGGARGGQAQDSCKPATARTAVSLALGLPSDQETTLETLGEAGDDFLPSTPSIPILPRLNRRTNFSVSNSASWSYQLGGEDGDWTHLFPATAFTPPQAKMGADFLTRNILTPIVLTHC